MDIIVTKYLAERRVKLHLAVLRSNSASLSPPFLKLGHSASSVESNWIFLFFWLVYLYVIIMPFLNISMINWIINLSSAYRGIYVLSQLMKRLSQFEAHIHFEFTFHIVTPHFAHTLSMINKCTTLLTFDAGQLGNNQSLWCDNGFVEIDLQTCLKEHLSKPHTDTEDTVFQQKKRILKHW